ncbi:hypothetical protein AB0F77_27025 [Streptomyces sp. NPDC026672]|uniref:hypothetical protein n=1 Tax=unclassified Streptomyces TaxID=2593676 RepID=UPI0033CDB66E
MTANGPAPRAGRLLTRTAAALVLALLVLLLLVIVRLPWVGDLGMHAATIERLRHSLLHPGNPLVDADTPSPYYSPWTLVLGSVARVGGLPVFAVLRVGALVGLALFVTGVWRYVRTLARHPAAPAVAVLCLLFLWGPVPFEWSGFVGLGSLALTVAYPSLFALGLSFHLWAWLSDALRDGSGRAVWLGLGTLWGVILLVHQFTGVVASAGALATVLAARPGRSVVLRLGAGLLCGVAVLWVWPYYDFFHLFSVGAELQAIHRPLYERPAGHFGLAVLGVAALAARWRRDGRDPLVLFFALGAVVFVAGGVTGHYSWGRALPAALIPAQLAAALEVFAGGRRAVRTGWACVLAGALAVGAWAQSGTVGYATGRGALPPAVAARYPAPWPGYAWITPWVRYGDVVMARTFPARQIPAYGAYTVAPGYPDVFLPDAGRREEAVRRYFAAGTSEGVRRGIEREYGVRWVVDRVGARRGVVRGAGLRTVARGPGGQELYRVVP